MLATIDVEASLCYPATKASMPRKQSLSRKDQLRFILLSLTSSAAWVPLHPPTIWTSRRKFSTIHLQRQVRDFLSNTMDVPPDFDFHQGLHEPELGVNLGIWIMGSLATLFLALRLYCRIYRMAGAWYDDYVLFAAWLTLMAGDASISYVLRRGFGTGPLVPDDVPLCYALYIIFSTWALTLTKTSWAITLLRLTEGWRKWVCWFAIATLLALGTATSFQSFSSACGAPTEEKWTLPGGCWSLEASLGFSMFAGAYNALMEIILAFLPWKLIWNLRLAQAEKIGICVSMSLGVIAACIAVVRLVITSTIALDDNLWYTITIVALLAQIEQSTTIIACSIPILRALLQNVCRVSAHAARCSSESHDWALHRNGSSGSTIARLPPTQIVQTREVTIEYVGDKPHAGEVQLETLNRAEKQL
ncbi:hypothetical protein F4809DRAFT_607703 [Biscogniauxia mediterranea]|nr:hypothetical protein F4809DRAFT_607703 [Biscogniauxia mediterranea]